MEALQKRINLLLVAIKEFGVKEIPGPIDNPRIVQYFQEGGFTWIHDDETAWCSAFMNWVAMKALLPRSHNLAAQSWLKVGMPTQSPIVGDVVVLWRDSIGSGLGHVGIFVSKEKGMVNILAGNQNNEVDVSSFPESRVLGYRNIIN